ncbi:uncharacterized protein LOC130724116 [Lotus japonicus]|uniref:uncharacterized protein LOC130724116 n=1 Tax=Lotus japonicus TaxID=34305 RepID=UPI0025830941|nr:uncharacterized protein LOC130724116 [Lotus japonicus]
MFGDHTSEWGINLWNPIQSLSLLATTPVGSTYILTRLDQDPPSITAAIVAKIKVELYSLINNPCGRRVVFSLFQKQHLQRLGYSYGVLDHLISVDFRGQLLASCINDEGVSTLNELMGSLNERERYMFTIGIRNITPTLMEHNNIHVILHLIRAYPVHLIAIIFNAIGEESLRISRAWDGVRNIMSCLRAAPREAQLNLLQNIISRAVELAEGGNCGRVLLHHLIEFDPLLVGHMLIIPFAGHVVRLSKTTFGSFVVRDLIERCAPWDAAIVIEEILSHPHSDIVHLAKDKIGNNVICFAVHHSEGQQHARLCGLLMSNAATLRQNMHGRRVLAQI